MSEVDAMAGIVGDSVLENGSFRVQWDGKYISGISKVSALARTTDVIDYRSGANPNVIDRIPGATKYDVITLERGRSFDTAFEEWAKLVQGFPSGASSANFRKDIRIEVMDEFGRLALAFNVFRCWPSRYQALSILDSNSDAVAVESLTLENEGWVRDASVAPPAP
jgi:phage tail-like protein